MELTTEEKDQFEEILKDVKLKESFDKFSD